MSCYEPSFKLHNNNNNNNSYQLSIHYHLILYFASLRLWCALTLRIHTQRSQYNINVPKHKHLAHSVIQWMAFGSLWLKYFMGQNTFESISNFYYLWFKWYVIFPHLSSVMDDTSQLCQSSCVFISSFIKFTYGEWFHFWYLY